MAFLNSLEIDMTHVHADHDHDHGHDECSEPQAEGCGGTCGGHVSPAEDA
ncbi:hypothetical protein AB0B45_20145 [Nonomuraea sp. NPDC049152]